VGSGEPRVTTNVLPEQGRVRGVPPCDTINGRASRTLTPPRAFSTRRGSSTARPTLGARSSARNHTLTVGSGGDGGSRFQCGPLRLQAPPARSIHVTVRPTRGPCAAPGPASFTKACWGRARPGRRLLRGGSRAAGSPGKTGTPNQTHKQSCSSSDGVRVGTAKPPRYKADRPARVFARRPGQMASTGGAAEGAGWRPEGPVFYMRSRRAFERDRGARRALTLGFSGPRGSRTDSRLEADPELLESHASRLGLMGTGNSPPREAAI